MHSVAELGAIFVLFSAGLEISPGELIRTSGKSLRVAVAGVVVPFLLGFFYMKLRGNVTSESVFVGAAMVATSVGITARVFADLHLLSTETAKIILGAAGFDDILGMLLLEVSLVLPIFPLKILTRRISVALQMPILDYTLSMRFLQN